MKPKYIDIDTCPSCGHEEVERDLCKDYGDCFTDFMSCNKCNAEWKQSTAVDYTVFSIEVDGEEYEIKSTPEALALQKLEAAAPEMLAALERIICCVRANGPHGTTMYFISDERMDDARQAVKKATGA